MSLCRPKKKYTNFPDLANEIQLRVLEFLLCDASLTLMIDDRGDESELHLKKYTPHMFTIQCVCQGLRMAAAEILYKTLELRLLTPSTIVDIGTFLPQFYLDRVRKLSIFTKWPGLSLGWSVPWSDEQVGVFEDTGFLTKALLAPLPNLKSLILDDTDLHCGGSEYAHVKGASTEEEVLSATNNEMVYAIGKCFDGGNCRRMIIDELDSLDRDLAVSIDIDVYLDSELADDNDIYWRVCYNSPEATLLHRCSLLTYDSFLLSASRRRELGSSLM